VSADRIDRLRRVALLKRFSHAVLNGAAPPAEATMFVAAAIDAWLDDPEVNLERDAFKVAAPRGSNETPQRLAERVRIADATPSALPDQIEPGETSPRSL
jgi:hypothetical protein